MKFSAGYVSNSLSHIKIIKKKIYKECIDSLVNNSVKSTRKKLKSYKNLKLWDPLSILK